MAGEEVSTSVDRQVLELGRLVSSHPAYEGTDWSYIALVATFTPQRRSLHGYVLYADGRWETRPPRDPERSVMRAFRRLHREMLARDGVGWLQCLLEVNRHDQTVAADFEYEDQERWSVTPDRIAQVVGGPTVATTDARRPRRPRRARPAASPVTAADDTAFEGSREAWRL